MNWSSADVQTAIKADVWAVHWSGALWCALTQRQQGKDKNEGHREEITSVWRRSQIIWNSAIYSEKDYSQGISSHFAKSGYPVKFNQKLAHAMLREIGKKTRTNHYISELRVKVHDSTIKRTLEMYGYVWKDCQEKASYAINNIEAWLRFTKLSLNKAQHLWNNVL